MKDKGLVFAIVFLGFTVLLSGFWIGSSMVKFSANMNMNTTSSEQRDGDTSGDTISFQEAAVLLDLTEDELQYLVKNSKYMDGKGIPYFKIGQKTIYSKSALSAWVIRNAENRVEY